MEYVRLKGIQLWNEDDVTIQGVAYTLTYRDDVTIQGAAYTLIYRDDVTIQGVAYTLTYRDDVTIQGAAYTLTYRDDVTIQGAAYTLTYRDDVTIQGAAYTLTYRDDVIIQGAAYTLTYGDMQHDWFFDIFCNRITNDLVLPPTEWTNVKCKYANRQPITDFLFDGNCNVCPLCYRSQDIVSSNMHDRYIVPRLNANMQIKSHCRTGLSFLLQ